MRDLLALTQALVDIPSESHHEAAITGFLAAELASRAPWLVLHRVGNNLVAHTAGDRPQRVLLAGHTDTVAVNGNLPGRIDGDVLHGLGATDMKAGLAVMLELACTVTDPAVEVTYVFYEAEEVAAVHNGLRRLFAEVPHLLAADVALLGEPTDGDIEAGCQGTMRVEVTWRGTRAHTARPWMGRNAVHRMAGALGRLAVYEPRQPVLDGCAFREAMQAVRVQGGLAGPDGSWQPGGNVVPDAAVLVVNHRFAPDRTVLEAEAHVRSVVAADLEDDDSFAVVDCATAAPPSLHHPLLAALVERNQLAIRAKLGWTDVARFAEHGIPATNFGPGDATLAHTAAERVHRAPIERTFAAIDDLLRRGEG